MSSKKPRVVPHKTPPRTEKQLAALKNRAYPKGTSGHPEGKPKGRPIDDAALKLKARDMAPEVLDELLVIGMRAKNESARVKALEIILALTMSKSATKHEVDIQVEHTSVFLAKATAALHQLAQKEAQQVAIEAAALTTIEGKVVASAVGAAAPGDDALFDVKN